MFPSPKGTRSVHSAKGMRPHRHWRTEPGLGESCQVESEQTLSLQGAGAQGLGCPWLFWGLVPLSLCNV